LVGKFQARKTDTQDSQMALEVNTTKKRCILCYSYAFDFDDSDVGGRGSLHRDIPLLHQHTIADKCRGICCMDRLFLMVYLVCNQKHVQLHFLIRGIVALGSNYLAKFIFVAAYCCSKYLCAPSNPRRYVSR